jgi:hypothetical protein
MEITSMAVARGLHIEFRAGEDEKDPAGIGEAVEIKLTCYWRFYAAIVN